MSKKMQKFAKMLKNTTKVCKNAQNFAKKLCKNPKKLAQLEKISTDGVSRFLHLCQGSQMAHRKNSSILQVDFHKVLTRQSGQAFSHLLI